MLERVYCICSIIQAKIQSGEKEGELKFRISWSKVTKRHVAEPVLESKDHSYLQEMLCDTIERTESVTQQHHRAGMLSQQHHKTPGMLWHHPRGPPGKKSSRTNCSTQDSKPRRTLIPVANLFLTVVWS